MIKHYVLIGALATLVAACDADTIPDADADSNIVQVNTASVTEATVPQILRTVSTLDSDRLQLQVRINDVSTTLERGEDDIWRGSVEVPMNQSSRAVVEWGTDFGTSGYVKLAEQQRFIFVGSDEATVVFDNDYIVAFDLDSDSRTNLVEIQQNRSPVNNLDVTINVDGTFATGGVTYPFSEECGQQIPIGTLSDGVESDNKAWWCATLESELVDADGNVQNIENLRITVNVEDRQLFTDSGTTSNPVSHHDDSVEIFIDGDDSKSGNYDTNDFQFRFMPLGDGVFTTPRGPRQPLNLTGGFEYYTGGYVLTAIIPLGEVGIRNRFPFGINVEVNDDDDGDTRDAKYSWVATEGEDIAWRNTSAFGTSQVP